MTAPRERYHLGWVMPGWRQYICNYLISGRPIGATHLRVCLIEGVELQFHDGG